MSLDASFSLHQILKIPFFPFGSAGSLLLHRLFLAAVHGVLTGVASLVAAHGLKSAGPVVWHMDLVVPWHVESSWARDQTHVSCTGRQILIHCATREVLSLYQSFTNSH